jgi:hypothetical protein
VPPKKCGFAPAATFLGEEQPVIQLMPEEVASFAESRAQASRREFVTDQRRAQLSRAHTGDHYSFADSEWT